MSLNKQFIILQLIIVIPSSIDLNGMEIFDELSNISLQCTVTANPFPLIVWLRRNEDMVTEIIEIGRTSIINHSSFQNTIITTSTLLIQRAQSSDQGEYICEASNEVTQRILVANKTIAITGIVRVITHDYYWSIYVYKDCLYIAIK